MRSSLKPRTWRAAPPLLIIRAYARALPSRGLLAQRVERSRKLIIGELIANVREQAYFSPTALAPRQPPRYRHFARRHITFLATCACSMLMISHRSPALTLPPLLDWRLFGQAAIPAECSSRAARCYAHAPSFMPAEPPPSISADAAFRQRGAPLQNE